MPATQSSFNFFTGRMFFLTPKQQCQSTEGKTHDLNTEMIKELPFCVKFRDSAFINNFCLAPLLLVLLL